MKKLLSYYYLLVITAFLLSCSQKTNVSSTGESKSTLLTTVLLTSLTIAIPFLISYIMRKADKRKKR